MRDYTIYVTEEIAKKAMEKGFEMTEVIFLSDKIKTFTIVPKGQTKKYYPYSHSYYLPTAEQICGWLRERKKIYINILLEWDRDIINDYYCEIHYKDIFKRTNITQSYEESILNGINKALDLI